VALTYIQDIFIQKIYIIFYTNLFINIIIDHSVYLNRRYSFRCAPSF
jgi:hypothetical protein